MPPVYKKLKIIGSFDGKSEVDMVTDHDIQLLYIPDYVNADISREILLFMLSDKSPLKQHTYKGNFARQITPKRLTYAHVPVCDNYRYKGKNLTRNTSPGFMKYFDILSNISHDFGDKPNAAICNGYRYNGVDYIALHTDDEKFLKEGNTEFWDDSTVFTFTFLTDPDKPMTYQFGNPDTGIGYSITPRHGSMLIQGRTLHEILPIGRKGNDQEVGRISITMRNLDLKCPHKGKCKRVTCPSRYGASNYLYYSNAGSH